MNTGEDYINSISGNIRQLLTERKTIYLQRQFYKARLELYAGHFKLG